MSFKLSATTDHLDAVGIPAIANGFALFCWFNYSSTLANSQGRFLIALCNSLDRYQIYGLGFDISGATGKLMGYASNSSVNTGAAYSAVITPNTWQHGIAVFGASGVLLAVYLNGANKVSSQYHYVASGLDQISVSGYTGNRNLSYYIGQIAHGGILTRIPSDAECRFLGLGGNPRALPLTSADDYWEFNSGQSPVADEVGIHPLTVTGSTAGTSTPDLGTWYTGAAIGAQVWQQGTAITAFSIGAGFDGVNSPFTVVLMKVGVSTGSTTTNVAAATATRIVKITSASAANINVGDYIAVGAGSRTRVLAVLVTTSPAADIFVKDAQTYSSGATVTRYPVAAATVPGITVSSSGAVSGTPTTLQSLTADYFGRSINTAQPTNVNLQADGPLFPITVNAIPTAPSFAIVPSVAAATVSGYQVAFAADKSCTAYVGAYNELAATPSIAQLKAGTGALASASKAVTGSDTLTLTGLDLPVHNLYMVLTNNVGDSALYSMGRLGKLPPAGASYRKFISTGAGTPFAGTPYAGNINDNDIEESRSQGGAIIQLRSDGHESYTGAGRQLRTARLYSRVSGNWVLDDSGSQTYNIWYNNVAPTFKGGTRCAVKLNVAMDPYDLNALFEDLDADVLSIAVLTALPSGLSASNGKVTGTPSVGFVGSIPLRATDIAGAACDGVLALIAGPIRVPNVTLLDYRDAEALLLGSFLQDTPQFVEDAGPPNIVLSQDPPALTNADVDSIVTLTVSRTPPGQLPKYGLRSHSFQCVPYYVNGDLDMRHPLGT